MADCSVLSYENCFADELDEESQQVVLQQILLTASVAADAWATGRVAWLLRQILPQRLLLRIWWIPRAIELLEQNEYKDAFPHEHPGVGWSTQL